MFFIVFHNKEDVLHIGRATQWNVARAFEEWQEKVSAVEFSVFDPIDGFRLKLFEPR
jgi:hypothetical protein